MKFWVTFCLILWGVFAFAKNTPPPQIRYLTTEIQKGEGTYALLRRYKLLDWSCSLDQFHKINKLKSGDHLSLGKKYNLPIEIKKFDGNSIRTSLDIKDYQLAKEIDIFNQNLVDQSLKKAMYQKDKELWVPIPIFHCKASVALTKNTSNPKSMPASKEPDSTQLVADEKLAPENTAVTSITETSIADKKLDSNDPEAKATKVSNTVMNVSLFGSRYSNFEVKSEALKDQIFYIVPGHGGPDPGAIVKNYLGKYTLCEDEYAYDVSLRLAKKLMEEGATVHIIVQDKNDGIRDEKYLDCDEDEICATGCQIPISQKKRLRQGMSEVNSMYRKYKKKGFEKQWMISIHIDSRPEDDRQDVFFYYQNNSKVSQKQAKRMQGTFADKYKKYQERDYNGSVSTRPLYVLRASDPEPIFIELANIRNEEDRKRILVPRNRQLLAEWMAESFIDRD